MPQTNCATGSPLTAACSTVSASGTIGRSVGIAASTGTLGAVGSSVPAALPSSSNRVSSRDVSAVSANSIPVRLGSVSSGAGSTTDASVTGASVLFVAIVGVAASVGVVFPRKTTHPPAPAAATASAEAAMIRGSFLLEAGLGVTEAAVRRPRRGLGTAFGSVAAAIAAFLARLK